MWESVERPGYFGRKRDEKVAAYDTKFGKGMWRLAWNLMPDGSGSASHFYEACRIYYEHSYGAHFRHHPELLEMVCTYGECYDNDVTNINSGLDYMKQEAYSTHIQDIAVRNVLRMNGRWFEGPQDKLLQIRSKDSEGYILGPGNIPFAYGIMTIVEPSLCPKWANVGSVEDFWQSNKWLQVWRP